MQSDMSDLERVVYCDARCGAFSGETDHLAACQGRNRVTTTALLSSMDRTTLSPRQPIPYARSVEVAQAAQAPDLIARLVGLEADETVVVDQWR